jgi:hypothetical protein
MNERKGILQCLGVTLKLEALLIDLLNVMKNWFIYFQKKYGEN